MDSIVERALISGGVPTASSAERWRRCPPSYNMEMALSEEQISEPIERGERLHKAMERWQEDAVTVASECGLKEDEAEQFMRACLFRQNNIEAIFGS
jgi:hypothetical protein